MTEPSKLGGVRYTALCTKGQHLQNVIDNHIGRRRTVAFHLMAAEDEHPTNVPKYRNELAALKTQIDSDRAHLMHHVAHCTDGCVRDASGGISASAFTNHRAPSHNKPPLPAMAELAKRLRDGEALEAIAVEYDRSPETIRPRITAAGFSARDGRPLITAPKAERPTARLTLLPDEPWRDDALCAQTDPDAFFPEKGGSTREAKAVCATCTVAAECLDYALEHDERHGIWGGLSERDRRRINRALRTNLDKEPA